MTPEPMPVAVPFDPGSGELPATLEPVFTEPDGPILLIVAAEADEAAARSAIALAQARASQGGTTVLADAGLDAPRLHRALDVENHEGLVDVFLFGASLERVTTETAHGFRFVPAGAYAPDPAEVLQSPRWGRVGDELGTKDALLMVFVPAAAPGARELSRRVGRAVLLGDERAAARAAERLDPSCEVVAVLDASGASMEGGAGAAAAAPAGAGEDGPDMQTAPRDPEVLDEPVVIRDRKERRKVSPILLIALFLALAAAAWFAYQELAGREAPPAAEPAPVAAPAAATDPGDPLDTPVPYSVAVEAHPDLASAMERARVLSRAEPSVGFHLAPVSVRGVLYYRLLAGPLTDREAAVALMQKLVDAGHKTAMDDWAVRPTTFAFHLGDYDTRDAAEARSRALVAQGVPAYVVPQPFESGAYRYRVYGGAYETQAEAEVMRELLTNAGEPAPLIERVGEPVG